jgi:hypothetical protein
MTLTRTITLSALLLGTAAQAEPLEFSGYIGAELSYFPETGLYPGQLSDTQTSLVFAPELRWRSDSGDTRARVSAFGRWDAEDPERSHIDLREAYIQHNFDSFDVLVGVNKVFWGVTESLNLVDIINQVDQLEYADSNARLGQPMIALSTDQDWGSLSAYVMTGFRERQYPGIDGRLRFGLPVDDSATTWGGDREEWAPDFALRYYNTFGSVDLGLSAFYGTSREAMLTPNGGGTALDPYYGRIWQAGIDAQYTGDTVLWKLEAITRGSDDFDTFAAVVTGFEYTFYQVSGSDSDLGVISEYLYDDRGTDAPVTIFQNDLFVGARWAANDSQDTSALVGAVIDLEDGTTSLRAEFERRLDIGVLLKLQAQSVSNADTSNPLYGLRQDNYLSVAFEKYF